MQATRSARFTTVMPSRTSSAPTSDAGNAGRLLHRGAAIPETLEETGWDVELTGVIGIYLYTAPSNGVTYQRVCFAGKPLQHHPDYQLDDGIIGPRWLTRDELLEQRSYWRSELIIQCIDDYLGGKLHSLELIRPSL